MSLRHLLHARRVACARRTLLMLLLLPLAAACGDAGPTAPPFAITIGVGDGLVIAQNDSAALTLTLGRVGGYAEAVVFTGSGLPSGVVLVSTTVPAGMTQARAQVYVSAQADTGTHTFTVTAAGVGVEPVSASATITVQPSGFSVTQGADSVAVERGKSASVTVDVSRFGSFRGPVELSMGPSPSGVTIEGTGTVPANIESQALQLSVQPAARLGTTDLTLVARAQGQPDQTRRLRLTVEGQDTLIVSVIGTVTVTRGGSVEVPVYVSRSAGFPEWVALEAFGLPAGVAASFTPSNVAPTVGQATLRIHAASDATDGLFQLSVRGRSTVPAQVNIGRTVPLVIEPPAVKSISMSFAGGNQSGWLGRTMAGTSEKPEIVMRDAKGAVVIGRTPTFTLSDSSSASVAADGMVTAREPGSSELTATIDGVSARVWFKIEPDLHNSTWRATWSASMPVSYAGESWTHLFLPTSSIEMTYSRTTSDWRDGYDLTVRITGVQDASPRGQVSSQLVETRTVSESRTAWVDGNFTAFYTCQLGCWNITPNVFYVWATNWGYKADLGGMDVKITLANVAGSAPFPQQEINVRATRVP